MQKYMRVCPICVKENNSIGENDVAGWIDWFKSEEILSNDETCPWGHDTILEKKLMTCEEFNILNKISKESSFMQAMEELKEKDIIEFNLKMSQFKSQAGQQESGNVPKCPTCGSTNVSKITVTKRAVKVGLFGIFGAIDDAGKTYKCDGCGCKF